MKKSNIKLTTAQFAKLHNVNKRTLHYMITLDFFLQIQKEKMDIDIMICHKQLNLKYILMLRELNVSIDDIEEYIKRPTEENFTMACNG